MRGHRESEEHIAWRKAHYEASDMNDKLIINLRDLSHTMRFLYEGRGSQKHILIVLSDIGGRITQSELTERLGIKPGSASEVIAKLESPGYIMRTPSETDRRTAYVELTESGKKAASDAKEQRIRRHEQMFSCLSDDEKNELLSLLEKVKADWETRYKDIWESHKRGCHHKDHSHHGKPHCNGGE